MATPVIVYLVTILAAAVVSVAAFAQGSAPAAYQWAAAVSNVPSSVLFAVALQESGITLRGRQIPWPWTLNIAGTGHRYPDRAAACFALQRALRTEPATRIDAGLAQLNVGYQSHRVANPCELLEPYHNLILAGAILREHHKPGDDWLIAIGRYHRPAGGAPAALYQRRVKRHLTRLLGATVTAATLRADQP
jgi:hypothetical protein